MKYLPILLALLLTLSCAPQKRFNRLVAHHPELVLHLTDTLIIRDTVQVPGIDFDTVWVSQPQDTLIYTDTITNTEVRIIRVHDTLMVSVTSPPDTIYIERLIPIDTIIAAPECPPSRRWFIWLGVGLTLLILALVRWIVKPST